MDTLKRIEPGQSALSVWVRRGIATSITLLFVPVVVFAVTLSGLRVSFSEPDVLIDALREADFYGYTHDYLVPSIVDDVFRETDHDAVRLAEPWKDDIAASLRVGFPPAKIQEETEDFLRIAWPYVRGGEDEFDVLIPIAPHAAWAFDDLSLRIAAENPEAYEPLIAHLTDRVNREAAGYAVTSDTIRALAPSDWLFPVLGQVVEDVGAYHIGETENSEITVPLDDQTAAIQIAVAEVLTGADVGNTSLPRSLMAKVEASLPADAVVVPGFGEVDGELVTRFILSEIPDEEIGRIKSQVIRDVSAYAVNQSDELVGSEVRLSLLDVRDTVPNVIAARADRFLAERFNAVPDCPSGQGLRFRVSQLLQGLLPPCVLVGTTYETYMNMLGLNVAGMTRDTVRQSIPLSIAIDSENLRATIASEALDLIEKTRDATGHGIAIDTANLSSELSRALFDDPNQLREYIRDGVYFSHEDIERAMGDDGESWLQSARQLFSRTVTILLWASTVVLLFLLAFIGGRGWQGRLTWASIALGIGAALAWLLPTASLDLAIQPRLEDLADDLMTAYTNNATSELVSRGERLISSLIESVAQNVKAQAIRVGVVAGVALIVARLLAAESVGRRPAGR